jgi:hypothetical protein
MNAPRARKATPSSTQSTERGTTRNALVDFRLKADVFEDVDCNTQDYASAKTGAVNAVGKSLGKVWRMIRTNDFGYTITTEPGIRLPMAQADLSWTPMFGPNGDRWFSVETADKLRFFCQQLQCCSDSHGSLNVPRGWSKSTTASSSKAEADPEFCDIPASEWQLVVTWKEDAVCPTEHICSVRAIPPREIEADEIDETQPHWWMRSAPDIIILVASGKTGRYGYEQIHTKMKQWQTSCKIPRFRLPHRSEIVFDREAFKKQRQEDRTYAVHEKYRGCKQIEPTGSVTSDVEVSYVSKQHSDEMLEDSMPDPDFNRSFKLFDLDRTAMDIVPPTWKFVLELLRRSDDAIDCVAEVTEGIFHPPKSFGRSRVTIWYPSQNY